MLSCERPSIDSIDTMPSSVNFWGALNQLLTWALNRLSYEGIKRNFYFNLCLYFVDNKITTPVMTTGSQYELTACWKSCEPFGFIREFSLKNEMARRFVQRFQFVLRPWPRDILNTVRELSFNAEVINMCSQARAVWTFFCSSYPQRGLRYHIRRGYHTCASVTFPWWVTTTLQCESVSV